MNKLSILLVPFVLAACSSVSEMTGSNSADANQQVTVNTDAATTANATVGGSTDATDPSQPPNARPGECYARVLVPGQKQTVTEKVLAKEAGQEVRIIPAQYENREVEVVVQEEHKKLRVVPATFKTVLEDVVVEPAQERIVAIPATYETVTEKKLVTPAKKVWKAGSGLINQSLDQRVGSNGDIMCLVEVPAVYQTVTKQVLKTPATTKSETIPAVVRKVEKTVVNQPERVEEVVIPAITKKVLKRVEVAPAKKETVEVPAQYKNVTKEKIVVADKYEWRTIVCQNNINPTLVSKVQQALVDKGYTLAVDGNFGSSTAAAVDSYQRSLGVVSTGITLETLRSLGIN